jgi:glycosyltransferase involved in cell wall biosynthesis
MGVSRGLDDYRAFIRASYGEFGVAKHTYVETRSGWFSDRTECYLASGRPAVVQDTGWSAHLPAGLGLLGFTIVEEAVEAIARIDADYEAHARAARAIAEEHFRSDRVLTALLEVAGS